MKKRKKRFGLKEIVLGGTMLVSSILPFLSKAQKINPENYNHDSYRQKMLPYCRPNLHLTENRESLDYDHSGDANGDNILDSKDSEAIRNGTYTYTNLLKADFFPDSIVNERDAEVLDSVLSEKKERMWEYMNRSERINHLKQVLSTDSRNYPPRNDIYWGCTSYARSHQKGFFGIVDEENSHYGDDELYGKNATKNIPVYSVSLIASNGQNHMICGILAGPKSNERLKENPENYDEWYFWNPSGPNELEEVKRGSPNYADTSYARIGWYGEMLFGTHGSAFIVEFDKNENLIYSHDHLIPFNPASDNEKFTFEGLAQDNLEVNYAPNLDLTNQINQMKADTAYAKSNLPTSLEKTVSDTIPLSSEYPQYNYMIEIKNKASTQYKDSTNVKTITVKDSENPKVQTKNIFLTQEQFNQYQNLEELIKTNVIESITDNTEIKDTSMNYSLTESNQNYDKYQVEVSAKDVFENEVYETAEIKISKPTTTGIESQKLEKIVAYPNPVKDNLNIKYNNACGNEKMHLEIYSTTGQTELQFEDHDSKYLSPGNGVSSFDISQLNPGIHIAQFTCGDKQYITKILKE